MPDPTEPTDPRAPTAIEELAHDDASRRKFMKLVGVGGAGAFATLLAACGSTKTATTASTAASAASTPTTTPAPAATSTSTTSTTPSSSGNAGDIAIVNYALTLEYLEADFYARVVASGLFKGKQQDLLKQIATTEAEHVTALTSTAKALGGTPATKPKTRFPLGSASAVVQLAATVENLGAAAYLGQAGNIKSKSVLAAALSIHSVEARHAAALNTLAGRSIVPDGAFARGASMPVVLSAVKPFIVG